MIFIIDRIDEGIAICETANGNSFPIPAALLGDVSEGDCIDVRPGGEYRIATVGENHMTVASDGIYAAVPVCLYNGAKPGDTISFVQNCAEREKRREAIRELADELFE